MAQIKKHGAVTFDSHYSLGRGALGFRQRQNGRKAIPSEDIDEEVGYDYEKLMENLRHSVVKVLEHLDSMKRQQVCSIMDFTNRFLTLVELMEDYRMAHAEDAVVDAELHTILHQVTHKEEDVDETPDLHHSLSRKSSKRRDSAENEEEAERTDSTSFRHLPRILKKMSSSKIDAGRSSSFTLESKATLSDVEDVRSDCEGSVASVASDQGSKKRTRFGSSANNFFSHHLDFSSSRKKKGRGFRKWSTKKMKRAKSKLQLGLDFSSIQMLCERRLNRALTGLELDVLHKLVIGEHKSERVLADYATAKVFEIVLEKVLEELVVNEENSEKFQAYPIPIREPKGLIYGARMLSAEHSPLYHPVHIPDSSDGSQSPQNRMLCSESGREPSSQKSVDDYIEEVLPQRMVKALRQNSGSNRGLSQRSNKLDTSASSRDHSRWKRPRPKPPLTPQRGQREAAQSDSNSECSTAQSSGIHAITDMFSWVGSQKPAALTYMRSSETGDRRGRLPMYVDFSSHPTPQRAPSFEEKDERFTTDPKLLPPPPLMEDPTHLRGALQGKTYWNRSIGSAAYSQNSTMDTSAFQDHEVFVSHPHDPKDGYHKGFKTREKAQMKRQQSLRSPHRQASLGFMGRSARTLGAIEEDLAPNAKMGSARGFFSRSFRHLQRQNTKSSSASAANTHDRLPFSPREVLSARHEAIALHLLRSGIRVTVHTEGEERVMRQRRILKFDDKSERLTLNRQQKDKTLVYSGEGIDLNNIHQVGVGAQTKILRLSFEHLNGSVNNNNSIQQSERCIILYGEDQEGNDLILNMEIEPVDRLDREEMAIARQITYPIAESILEMTLLAWISEDNRVRKPLGDFANSLAVELGDKYYRPTRIGDITPEKQQVDSDYL